MGASSITGVGAGAAENKGPGNGRNTFVPLTSPKILLTGQVLLDGDGEATVAVSGIPGGEEDHGVFVSVVEGSVEQIGRSYNEDGLIILSIVGSEPNRIAFYMVTSLGKAQA